MRYAILSDIHSNLTAFQSVIQDIDSRGGIDELWCLGDTIGYGPDPGSCIDLLRQYNTVCVAGNHDLGSIGKIDIADFNSDAAVTCRWTGNNITQEQKEFLANLPLTIQKGQFTLAHGSPREPVWEYLLTANRAYVSFGYFDTTYCLVGHSHVPVVFKYKEGESNCSFSEPISEAVVHLGTERLIINPGSVGQPRDGDPRASYIIYNSAESTITYHRVPYDISAVQKKMVDLRFPSMLAARLTYGW